LASLQPYFFGVGILIFSVGMQMAGHFGVPRRHWDIVTFGGSPFAFEFNPVVHILMAIMAVGAILAVLGGAIYVGVTVVSVFFGKKIPSAAVIPGR
jgi:cytochrome c oxidase subunit 1